MARDTAGQAMTNSGTAQGLSKGYATGANNTSSILTPTLNRMATTPQGFTPQTMNNMNTAAMQSIGGANAGIVGQGNLQAARTNNAGGFQAGATAAGHDATAVLSDAALGVQNRNAMLQEQQRMQGVQGLENQYRTDVGATGNALRLSNESLGAATEAQNQTLGSWLGPMQAILQAGSKQNTGLTYGI